MGIARWFFALAVMALPVQAEVTWFKGHNTVSEFTRFLSDNVPSGEFTRTFTGKTQTGKDCSFVVTKKNETLTFLPATTVVPVLGEFKNNTLAHSSAYVVDGSDRANGGHEGNKLWSSYFIDRKSPGEFVVYPHGQFGVSFKLELVKNDDGKLIQVNFFKTRHEDLGFFPLARFGCRL